MKLHSLKPGKGITKAGKRVGRGQGSGKGGTSTRGHKGAKSRSGYSKKLGFEGGQMPLQRRIPKFGFKNINRKEYKAVNLDMLQRISESFKVDVIDVDVLVKASVVSKKDNVKILGKGELSNKLEVKAHAFSKSAQAAIEKTNGVVTII